MRRPELAIISGAQSPPYIADLNPKYGFLECFKELIGPEPIRPGLIEKELIGKELIGKVGGLAGEGDLYKRCII